MGLGTDRGLPRTWPWGPRWSRPGLGRCEEPGLCLLLPTPQKKGSNASDSLFSPSGFGLYPRATSVIIYLILLTSLKLKKSISMKETSPASSL